MKWIAVVSTLAAIALGVFAFQRDQAANAALAQVESLKSESQKALAERNAAQSERDALRKASDELKAAAQEARSEADVAVRFLDAEKAVSAKLREDLAMTSARLAAASKGSRQAAGPEIVPPGGFPPGMEIIRRPIVVRAAPGVGQTNAVAATPGR